jgi:thiamine-phosphate pyrophosphorylase
VASSPSRPDLVLPRLYAILDSGVAAARGLDPVTLARAWFDAGVRLLQLRGKDLTLGPMTALARQLVDTGRAHGARLIVNDRADAARLAGADGVHVGQDDLTPAEARRIAGAGAIVGVSTHTPEQIAAALEEPIDYLAIGPVFPTGSKASAWPTVGLDGVRAAARAVGGRLPLVAIGGISLDSAAAVIAAGASSVAVISDLVEEDPMRRAGRYLARLG